MHIAEACYTLPGRELTLIIYFDLKAFEDIKPPLDKEETENFIRIISDSLTSGLTYQSGDRYFFIKRVLINPITQQLKLLCTDGFLIDSSLILHTSLQPFSKERIHISEIEQLPTRLNLSNEMIKNINNRLLLFEEKSEDFPQIEMPIIKEPPPEKISFPQKVEPVRAREATDVLFEIKNIKKEIKEISQDKVSSLKKLIDSVDNSEKYLHDEMLKEVLQEDENLENKKLLDDFTMRIISQAEKANIKKIKDILDQKLIEITAIPPKFENQIEVITESIYEQIKILTLFKQYIINALYDSAKAYYYVLLSQIKEAKFYRKHTLITEFNKKFLRIAELSEMGELSEIDYARENLQYLSFENLQDVISSDDRENPGLLQKCNTSWTEESSELQIVLQNLIPLNNILTNLLTNEKQFSAFAGLDMITITRTPFPRRYLFKFTQNMFNYKKAVEDFCQIQKDKIVELEHQYKKTMQINEMIENAQQRLIELQKQVDSLKIPLVIFKDLLKRKKITDVIINNVNQDLELTQIYLSYANQLQDKIKEKHDMDLNIILPRIRSLIHELEITIIDKNKMRKLLTNTKYQMDMLIQDTTADRIERPNFFNELNDKISQIENVATHQITTSKNLQAFKNKLNLYETVYSLSEKIGLISLATHIKHQKNEAKSLLLQLIKNQIIKGEVDHQLKRNMIEIYSHLDAKINSVDKLINELKTVNNKLFSELNADTPNLLQVEDNLNNLQTKWQSLGNMKNEIDDHLSHLKELTNYSLS